MSSGLKMKECHDLSTKYVRTGRTGSELGIFCKLCETVISGGVSLGERGDVVDHLVYPNCDFHHHALFS